MNLKKTLVLLLAALLCLPLFSAPAEEGADSCLGEALADFTVETNRGERTLSGILKEKKAVLINLWTSWCGPCAYEMPFMQEAYEQYQDQVEMVALSVDPKDTMDVISRYAEEHRLTFPMGNGSEEPVIIGLMSGYVPTTIVVDRFGTVVLYKVEAQPSAAPFKALFARLCAEDYTKSAPMEDFPEELPEAAEIAEGVWKVRFVDQNGDPVPGCIVNFCTDTLCRPVVADGGGVAVFEGEPAAYHLQVIKVPAGYRFDTTQEFTTEGKGGELTFAVTKE